MGKGIDRLQKGHMIFHYTPKSVAHSRYVGLDVVETAFRNDHDEAVHHMHVINGRLGLHTPIICTPEQLLTEGNEI